MRYQPSIRVALTFLVAALSTVVATVDDETIRLICAPIISGLAAIGIVPPQVPTRTSIDTDRQPVNVVHEQDGYSIVEALLAVFLVLVILILLTRMM